MIIENGHIAMATKVGGGIDPVTRHPIVPTLTWGEAIPCQYGAQTQNLQAEKSDDTHYELVSYWILVEAQPIEGEQVRLSDANGDVVGEFSIIKVEPLDAVDLVRIIV